MRALRLAFAAGIVAGSLFIPLRAMAAPPANRVVSLSVTGVVDPFLASYVKREIARANQGPAAAVLVTIDTPGGLGSSMREIVQAILSSRVPVICFVAPQGARAASAGTFILISCPIAAMAPGTNVGAAHPVGLPGAIESEKATNDAAAYIRSLAEQRGRNADWAERAVRESVSISAEEARRIAVIDLVEPDQKALLEAVDGRTVTVQGGTALLRTTGIPVEERSMGLGSRLLHAIFSPDLAFLFFYGGIALIVLEILHPGIGLAGILGGLMLVGAFVAFGELPVTLVGVTLLLASAASFLVGMKTAHVLATAVGLVTLVLGGLFLFDSSVPGARVSIWAMAVIAGSLGLFFGVAVQAVLKARRRPVVAGKEAILGKVAIASTDLDPVGIVRAMGEEWSAESTGGTIRRGEQVTVTGFHGIRLEVEPLEASPSAPVPADATVEGSEG